VNKHQQTIARRCQQAPTKQSKGVLMNINRPQQGRTKKTPTNHNKNVLKNTNKEARRQCKL
jgi:hypothetical protein